MHLQSQNTELLLSWVCLYPSIVLSVGGDFLASFAPLLCMQHKEPGKAKRRALSSPHL